MALPYKTPMQLQHMNTAGLLIHQLFRILSKKIRPGLLGKDLEIFCNDYFKTNKLEPLLLGYQGFPASICLNINQTAAHGVPAFQEIQAGDLVTVDTAVRYKGFCADAAWTYLLPPYTGAAQKAVFSAWQVSAVASKALLRGKGLSGLIYDSATLARQLGVQILSQFGGHGIGRSMHEKPRYSCQAGLTFSDIPGPGLVLSVEPIVSLGSDAVLQKDDGSWQTQDGALCAQFEHNIYLAHGDTIGQCLTLPELFLLDAQQAPF